MNRTIQIVVVVTVLGLTAWCGRAANSVLSPMKCDLSVAGSVYCAALQADGKLIIGGDFQKVNGYGVTNLARINADGSVDTNWNPNANTSVWALAVSGTNIYAGGAFTWISGEGRSGFAVLNETPSVPEMLVLGTNGVVIASGEAASAAEGTDFGHLLAGTSLTNTLSITNTGNATLTISGVTTSGAGAASFQISSIPSSIPAGAVSNFTVAFSPPAVGSFTAALSITNNSPTTPYVVNLSGSAWQLSNNIGPYAGGNTITITNGNLGTITNVLVGGVAAQIVTQGVTWVTITLPATSSAGVKDILIQSESLGNTTLSGAYTYNPAGIIADSVLPGPAVAGGGYHSLGLKADGTIVAWGWNVSGQTNVPAPNVNFGVIPAIDPSSGSCAGGYPVTIQGSNLCDGADATDVTLCGVSVTSIDSKSATQVVVTAGMSPAGGIGDVRVFSTSYGETVKSNAFTYIADSDSDGMPDS